MLDSCYTISCAHFTIFFVRLGLDLRITNIPLWEATYDCSYLHTFAQITVSVI